MSLYAKSDVLRLSWCGQSLGFGIPNNSSNISGLELGFGSKLDIVNGLQLNIAYSNADRINGLQISLLNKNNYSNGLQIGLRNISYERMNGLQIGLINTAKELHGLQIGIINKTTTLKGLQLGVFNSADNGVFAAMIIANGRF